MSRGGGASPYTSVSNARTREPRNVELVITSKDWVIQASPVPGPPVAGGVGVGVPGCLGHGGGPTYRKVWPVAAPQHIVSGKRCIRHGAACAISGRSGVCTWSIGDPSCRGAGAIYIEHNRAWIPPRVLELGSIIRQKVPGGYRGTGKRGRGLLTTYHTFLYILLILIRKRDSKWWFLLRVLPFLLAKNNNTF